MKWFMKNNHAFAGGGNFFGRKVHVASHSPAGDSKGAGGNAPDASIMFE
jgi:hypothetical protein